MTFTTIKFRTALLLACILAPSAMAADDPPIFTTEECAVLPWPIPFATGKAELSSFAIHRLDDLAAAWRVDPGPILASGRVDGQEDTRGETLSAQRLRVVLRALEDRGVARGSTWSRDDGGSAGVAPNTPGQPEPQNRTVWIELPSQGTTCARRLSEQRRAWIARHCFGKTAAEQGRCESTLDALR